MLTGDQIPADDLLRMGLDYKVFPDSEFAGEVTTLARRLAAGPTYTLNLMKEAVRASAHNNLEAQLDLERDLQRKAGASRDFSEGAAAFREKRPPRFEGR
jgi:2-(1,2-epoxy-1,2-dihydrophenyl)acetyl-CoA isomerase